MAIVPCPPPHRPLRAFGRLSAGIVLVCLWAAAAAAAETSPPDAARHSFIAEVDGYAHLSEEMTLSETRRAAFLNAKRQAVEMARTYIRSHTAVENFVLQSDTVEGTAEGAVTVLAQKDVGVEDNARYHVWIRAEVAFGPSAPDRPAAGASMDSDGPLTVRVWSSRKEYRRGERIEIFVQGNRDFYARIVDIPPDGDIIQLLPNDYRRDTRFEGGRVYRIPGPEDGFELVVSPPYGRDQIVVYASEAPLGEVATDPVGQGLHRVQGDRSSLAVRTRGIAVVGAGQRPAAATQAVPGGAAFYEGTWSFTTRE